MEKECPFWREDRECASKECGIQNCDDEVPAGLRTPRPNRSDEVYIAQVLPSRARFTKRFFSFLSYLQSLCVKF